LSVSKDQIAEAFGKRVDRYGYAKTTLDEVAADMHISKKTIYVHFENKRDIYAYLVEGQARQERLKMKAAVASQPSFAAKLEMLMRLVMGSARAHINETSEGDWLAELEIAGDAFRKANGDLMRELVQGGMDAGEFRRGDAELVEKMVAAMIVEYLLLVNTDPAYDRDDELMERTLRFIG
jgi:AcrR family transcriptional regulator